MKYLNLPSLLCMFFIVLMSSSAKAIIYDETDTDNDFMNAFSKDILNMTTLQFDPGSNTVRGTADNDTQYSEVFKYGADFFRFSLSEGESLTAINLINYAPFDSSSLTEEPSGFFGIGDLSNGNPRNSNSIPGLDPSDENTDLFNASLFTEADLGPLGGPHYNLLNRGNRSEVDEFGDRLSFIQDFSGDLVLGPGDYWVWLSEATGEFTYDLEFVIDSDNVVATPIPASVFLLVGPLGLLLRFKRKTA